ncbi:LptM family lipoprotein [Vagococcus teuberi]|uniref:Cell-wall binding lipoprotein n=1 Tax=Vagococcus teuberi TaxID=519472 RepID=A0A1J0A759_9ENTE|nr:MULTISPECIES: hypothetical protein [Vagococcus]APB31776.1 hypothetical protein BHY08_08045 [Vagococcus teuberi]RHH71622.1 hypothetical protein DW196_03585 [Vagococcus sp. AM17-17]
MSRIKSFLLLSVFVFTLSACGITQELDQSVTVTENINHQLKEEKQTISSLNTLIEHFSTTYDKEIHEKNLTDILGNDMSSLNKSYDEREEILSTLKKDNKLIKSYNKELKAIISKKAVDVDNTKLVAIQSSVDIIINNIESLQLYLESSLSQEKELYNDVTVDTADALFSAIDRANGATLLVTNETLQNISYTTDLINDYQKSAPSNHK